MKLRLIKDVVAVLPDPAPTEVGGISVVTLEGHRVGQGEARLGTVVAAGPGAWKPVRNNEHEEIPGRFRFDPMQVKVGERVVLNPWMGRQTNSFVLSNAAEYGLPEGTILGRSFELLAGEYGGIHDGPGAATAGC